MTRARLRGDEDLAIAARAVADPTRIGLLRHIQASDRPIAAVAEHGRRDFPFGPLANPIRMMTLEHDRAGRLLQELRRATADYTLPEDASASYRSLHERLAALEHDTRVNIHKENHVLFPAALRAWDDTGPERGEAAP